MNFESPIECDFAHHLTKYLREDLVLESQVEIKTVFATFRIDFVVRSGSNVYAFECDGAEFHDPWRDEVRDAIILGESHVDVIYRIAGGDIVYNINDILFLMTLWDPDLFSGRGRDILDRLRGIRVGAFDPRDASFPTGMGLALHREVRDTVPGRRQHWRSIHKRATEAHDGSTFDQLVVALAAQNRGSEGDQPAI